MKLYLAITRPRHAFALLLTMCSPAAFAWGPGELFIANYNSNAVTVYSRTASGAVTPRRTIQTGLTNPFGVLVDLLHGEVFVANNTDGSSRVGSVKVYDLNANYPNDSPKRTIAGSATGLVASTGMALDQIRQELYVANDDASSITVYARTANGNVVPSRTITGALTNLNGPLAVTLDLLHDEIIVVNKVNTLGGAGRITVYRRGSNGNVAPIRSIEGISTQLDLPVGMDLDLLHNEIVVANGNGNTNSVLVFHRTDQGNVAPFRTLTGPNTGLCAPYGVVADIVNNELVVGNSGFRVTPSGYEPLACHPATTVYPRGASGDTRPLRTIDLAPSGGSPYPVAIAETLLSIQ